MAGTEAGGWLPGDEASAWAGGAGSNAWLVAVDGTAGTGEEIVTGTPSRRNRSMSRCRVRAALS